MDEHRKFLADRLLSENQPISYRFLSTWLDVHVNRAKGILFDFHQYQNTLLKDSVHATYLVCGIAAPTRISDDAGSNVSYHLSDVVQGGGNKKLTLVGEEDLPDVLGRYKSVTSIHIYGLSPKPMKNYWFCQDLVNTTNDFAEDGNTHATLGNKRGAVCNPHVRLRDRKLQTNSLPTSLSHSAMRDGEQASHDKEKTIEAVPKVEQHSTVQRERMVNTFNRAAPKTILQSFGKKPSHATTKYTKQKKQEDEPAAALSDDGEPDDSDILPSKVSSGSGSNAKSLKDREEALKRMMEVDDEEEEQDRSAKPAMENLMEESTGDIHSPETEPEREPETEPSRADKEPSEIVSSTGNGRRRGKRRVMKKKRILDDQGYMVTIQEPAWESFSEDEMTPSTKRTLPAPTQPSSSAKAKKTVGKGSQGSIMSFFAKK